MWKHSATGRSPFKVLYGYNPPYSADSALDTKVPAVAEHIQIIQEVQEDTTASLQIVAQHTKDRDLNQKLLQWEKGTLVWLEGTHIWTTHLKFKLVPKQYGPFEVLAQVGSLAYKLKIPNHWRIHLVFYVSMMKEYRETEEHGPNFLKPPPEVLNDKEHYEVEAVLDLRKQGKGTKYLVKWEGYPEADNTWEPYALLKEMAEKALQDFHEQYPDKPRPAGLTW